MLYVHTELGRSDVDLNDCGLRSVMMARLRLFTSTYRKPQTLFRSALTVELVYYRLY